MQKRCLWYQIEEPEGRKLFKAFRYWIAQGMLYADNTERVYKVIFELIILVPVTLLLLYVAGLNGGASILTGLSLAHNVNFIVNCAVWETLICDLGFRGAGRARLVAFVKKQRCRLSKEDAVAGAFLYGSFARGELHDRSDLDVVIVRKRGFKNAVLATYILTKEKILALGGRIPLELFLADSATFLARPMSGEILVIIDDKAATLATAKRSIRTIEEAEVMNGLAPLKVENSEICA